MATDPSPDYQNPLSATPPLDVSDDAMSQDPCPLRIEIPLFVRIPRKVVRRVEVQIVRRVVWTSNPILPDLDD